MMIDKPKAVTKTGLTERSIARVLAVGFFARRYLVMVPNCNWTGNECDLLALDEKLRVIDVEVKISRADLKADAHKDKWFHYWDWKIDGPYRPGEGRQQRSREWPQKVWKHYYCMPKDIWSDDLFDVLPSTRSGVLLITYENNGQLRIALKRRAQANKDAKPVSPESAVNIARLASLRMWEWELRAEQRYQELMRYHEAAKQGGAA
jgi:hypothetical protein